MGNRFGCLGVKRAAPVNPGDTQQSHKEGGSFAGGVASPSSACSRCRNFFRICNVRSSAQETRAVSNAGIGCGEKPEGHLLNADRSRDDSIIREYGGSGGGGGGVGGIKRAMTLWLICFSPRNVFSASRSPPSLMTPKPEINTHYAPPPSYSPQSQIFPPTTRYPPPPPPPSDSLPISPLSENNTDDPAAEMGRPPPPVEDNCLPFC